jgi:hypothetical protein
MAGPREVDLYDLDYKEGNPSSEYPFFVYDPEWFGELNFMDEESAVIAATRIIKGYKYPQGDYDLSARLVRCGVSLYYPEETRDDGAFTSSFDLARLRAK